MLRHRDMLELEPALHTASAVGADSGAVNIDELAIGATLEIETGHTTYRMENRGHGQVLISGHPEYCPEPLLVDFQGSVGGPALLKAWHIEPGMKMAFQHPKFGTVRTSRVRSIRRLVPASLSEVH
jgi:hypothetical protein